MKQSALPLYAFTHFFVDFSCTLLLLGKLGQDWRDMTAFLLYNFFAFAVQLPLGLLSDRLGKERCFAALGCLLTAAAWLFTGFPAAIAAGLGNALFHVGGGLYALNSSNGCTPLGIFVSPGALGLFLGALPSVQAALPEPVVPLVLFLLGSFILRRGAGAPNAVFTPIPQGGTRAVMPLVCFFTVVVLRALMGGIFQFPWKGELGLWLALAVAGGKAAGGLLADRFGASRTATGSLALAAICFLGSDVPAAGLLAVFAFNMTMPITLWGAGRILRGAKGMAFGLLTFALFLGTLPILWGVPTVSGSSGLYAVGAVGSFIILGLGLRAGEGLT